MNKTVRTDPLPGPRDQFYTRVLPHAETLRAFASGRLGPAARTYMDTDDLMQDALVRGAEACERDPTLLEKNDSAFVGWIRFLIRDRAAPDAGRAAGAKKRGGGKNVRLETGAEANIKHSRIPTPSEDLKQAEALRKLTSLLETLPERERDAVVLVRLECKSLGEAAAIMGITPGSVKVYVARGLKRFK